MSTAEIQASATSDQPPAVSARAIGRPTWWAGQPSLVAGAGLTAVFAVLICLRMPDAILHGRLWAEEGLIFYSRAATLPLWNALFATFGGYLNIVASGAPLVARALVPLEGVPWVTTGVGLMFQCLPAVLLIGAEDEWLRRPGVRVACLLLLATAPVTEEVWLQTLHSQIHLAVCGALILALDVPKVGWRWLGFVLLFLGPLSGPAAGALTPLFLVRAALDRSPVRLAQGLVLGTATGLQVVFFYTSQAGREHAFTPATIASIFYIKQIVVPFLGRAHAQLISTGLKGKIAAGVFPYRGVLITLAFLGGLGAVVARRRLAAPVWLVASALLLFGISLLGSLSTPMGLLTIGEAGRYSFAPEVLLGLALVAVASGARREAWLVRAAVLWLIVVGVADLRRTAPYVGTGPDWLSEVAAWRQDHSHPIDLWPRSPDWHMTLPHE